MNNGSIGVCRAKKSRPTVRQSVCKENIYCRMISVRLCNVAMLE